MPLLLPQGWDLLASAALGFFAEPFVRMVGLEAALLPDAVSYLRITGGAAIILALSTMMSTIFRCYGNARVPMAVVVLNNILNIMGTSLVIFRPFEIPLTGVAGVAVVRAASECVGLIFKLWLWCVRALISVSMTFSMCVLHVSNGLSVWA